MHRRSSNQYTWNSIQTLHPFAEIKIRGHLSLETSLRFSFLRFFQRLTLTRLLTFFPPTSFLLTSFVHPPTFSVERQRSKRSADRNAISRAETMMVYRRFDPVREFRSDRFLSGSRSTPTCSRSVGESEHGGTNDEETSVANTARPLSGFQRRMERSGSTVMLARR